MTIAYATYSEFTLAHSVHGISQAELSSYWLPYGSRRVNEELGAAFTTPFSTNNETARGLAIDYAMLGILISTRDPEDSEELRSDLDDRIADIACHGKPMVLTDGTTTFPDRLTTSEFWSNTQDYKSVFDMRSASDQRVDPDYLDALDSEDS